MRTWAFLFLLLPLAGCLADTDDGPDPVMEPGERRAADILATAPAIAYDAEAAIDWWEDIATNYPKHDANTPTNQLLRDHLIAELQGIGMDVEVRSYASQPRGVPLPDTGVDMLQYHAIVATKPGATDNRVGLVSHYDTQTMTIHGAYDDASGVAAQFHICKALMEVEMNHTLSCVFFDAEEQGLVASDLYVQDAVASGEHVYDYVLGYDMTGINWPGHDWNMYMMTGPAEEIPWLQALGQDIMHNVLDYPVGGDGTSGVTVLDTHDRNSDERRFKEVGIPIYRFAGGRNAADYPQYHMPQDTVEYVYEFTGGRGNFRDGFSTIVEGSYHTILVLDEHSPASLRALYA